MAIVFSNTLFIYHLFITQKSTQAANTSELKHKTCKNTLGAVT